MEGERRQITVLFCDMVGSTEMSGRLDVEEYREVLQLYQQTVAAAVAAFNGHVAQYLGDGVVAYFGWPLAYGDDAERAVRAGLEILDALNNLSRGLSDDRKIAARVGIHTGPVLLGQVGVGAGHQIAALGETPNVAARAQSLASRRGVVITDATRRLVSGRFVIEAFGSHLLKGVTQPVELYCVQQAAAVRRPLRALRASGPFIGRNAELAGLREVWARVKLGAGWRVLIKGEPGIGKSRLLRQFGAEMHDQPHSRFEIFGSPFSLNTPFAPVVKALENSFLRRARSPQAALEKIARAVAAAGVKPELAVPAIAEMMGLPVPSGYLPLLSSPEQKRRRFILVVGEWLLGLARLQPLVIVIEDAQWADPSTMELAEDLIDRGRGLPLMLIYAARPEFELPAARSEHSAVFGIGRLTQEETLALIRAAQPSAGFSAAAMELVADRSGGVPLFVEELAGVIADQKAAPGAAHEIPATLADSLMARLDRLGAAKELAQIAAVIGREFSYSTLRAISGDSEVALVANLQRLLDSDVIHSRGNPPEARYSFKHALVRDAAYDSLLRSRRRRLHGAVARELAEQTPLAEHEPERLAYHWSAAGEADAASRAWESAGAAAAKRGALIEAASHYAKAVEMLSGMAPAAARDQREMSLLMTLASILSAIKGLASSESKSAHQRARELGRRLHPERSAALLGLWQGHVTRGEAIAAQALAEQRLQIAQSEKSASALCRSHLAVGMTLFHRGRIAQSINHLHAAVECYVEDQGRVALFDAGPLAMAYLAVALGLAERRDEAREMSVRALRAAEQLESQPTLAFCKLNCAALHWLFGEPREALHVARAGAAAARAHGLEQLACGLDVYAGWAIATTGDALAGVAQIRTAIAGWLANGQRLPHAWFLSLLASGSAMAGAAVEALEMIDEAEAAVGEMLLEETIVRSARAEILTQSGAAPDIIEAGWLRVIESARRNGAVLFEIRADIALANLVNRSGAQDRARVSLWTTDGHDGTAMQSGSSGSETTKPALRH